jgi:hypothetical protein
VAPEFQITHESSVVGYLNFMQRAVAGNVGDITPDYSNLSPLYGSAPVIANNGPDDVGQWRLLPSTSVDQYAATLGRWFGIGDTDLLGVLPNLGRWDAGVRGVGFV